jgi:hypothetical protein
MGHGGGLVARRDGEEHFFAKDGDFPGRLDPDFYGIAIDPSDADLDRVADNNRFVYFAREDKHGEKGLGTKDQGRKGTV